MSEMNNKKIMEMTRCLLLERKIPNHYWLELVNTFVYFLNRLPTRTLHDMNPYEALCVNKPSVKHLRIIGCICYHQVLETKMNKVVNKDHKGIFMGYNSSKGYMIFSLKIYTLILIREVMFDEASSWEWKNLQTAYFDLFLKELPHFHWLMI